MFLKFENPRRGRSSSEQIIFRKLSLGAPGLYENWKHHQFVMKQLSYRFIELTFFVPMRFIFKVDVYQFWCCNKTYWSVLCSYFSQQGIPIIRRHLCQTQPLLRDRREYMITNASTFVTQCVTGWAKLSFYLNLSKITKAEESLPTSYFRLPTSNFQLPTSGTHTDLLWFLLRVGRICPLIQEHIL